MHNIRVNTREKILTRVKSFPRARVEMVVGF